MSVRPKSKTLTITRSVLKVDPDTDEVVEDEVSEDIVVHPGHYLYRLFSEPGVRAFRPRGSQTVRITEVLA